MALNFGAPGDRRDQDGKLWLAYPRPIPNPRLETSLDVKLKYEHAFNAGGGIYVMVDARSHIYRNVIRNNVADAWGGGGINLWSGTLFSGAFSHVYNNIIVGNVATGTGPAEGGGGIYSHYDASRIYNNTLAGNRAHRGGGIYVATVPAIAPWVTNCIVWLNFATAGPEMGRTMRKKAVNSVQPSTLAASKSSLGIDMKKALKMKIERGNPPATMGMISPKRLSVMPILTNMT